MPSACLASPSPSTLDLRPSPSTLARRYYFECRCEACVREAAAAEALPKVGAAEGAADEPVALRLAAQRLDEEARAACEAGAYAAAAELSGDALRCLRRVFPAGSTQLAHEEAKLGRLRFNADADGAARVALLQAAASLRKCYGDACDEARELRRLAAMCSTAGPALARRG